MLLPHKQQSGPFRPQQPLVAVGRQKIDAIGLHIERKNAQPLNRIEKEQAAAAAAKLGDLPDIDSPARGIADPAHADDPRPLVAGCREAIEIDTRLPRPARGGPRRPATPGSSTDTGSKETRWPA